MVKVAQRLKDLSNALLEPAACLGLEVSRDLRDLALFALSREPPDLPADESRRFFEESLSLRDAFFPGPFDSWAEALWGRMDVCSSSDSSRERSETSSCVRSGSPPRKSRG